MVYNIDKNVIVLRIEKGEEILTSLLALCEREDIQAGTVIGLGASDDATVGLLRTKEKRYVTTELKGDMEIVSLSGNISRMDGKPYLHLHASFADAEYNVKGGHLNRAVVSATAELFITVLNRPIGRFYSEEVGLNLIKF